MRFKIVLIIGSIALIALAVAACGGGSNSTSGGTTAAKETAPSEGSAKTTKSEGSSNSKRLTKAEFTTLVNESCIQVPPTYEENRKKLEKGGKTPTKPEINLKAAVPPLYIALEEMKTLSPPAGEEGTLEEVISALEAAAKGLEAEPNSELSGPKSPFAEFQKVTKEKGFETCAGL